MNPIQAQAAGQTHEILLRGERFLWEARPRAEVLRRFRSVRYSRRQLPKSGATGAAPTDTAAMDAALP